MNNVINSVGAISLFLVTYLPGPVFAEPTGRSASAFFASQPQVDLLDAAATGNTAKMNMLVQAGAEINQLGTDGMSAPLWAMIKQQKQSLAFLLEHGGNPNLEYKGISVMWLAALSEDPWYLKTALEHGGNPNLVNSANGRTPIFASISALRRDNVRMLVKSGAGVDSRDNTGATPLMLAAGENRYDFVWLLLELGANPLAKDGSDKTLVWRMQHGATDPDSEMGRWKLKVKAYLEARGIEVEPKR